MRFRSRDVAIASRCLEAAFILTVEDNLECIEGVETFKYLGRLLDRSDDEWLEVLRNVGKARRLWSWLGKLIQREGADP